MAAGRLFYLSVISALVLGAPLSSLAWEWDGVPWANYTTFLGPIDAATKSNLQSIAADGATQGRVLGRMGQIGDSITESSAYFRNAILNDILANETAHDYAPIRSWLAYSGLQPADASSFYGDHGKGIPYGNKGGWRITDAISAGHPETGVEVGDETTPGDFSWALVMFGTNDIDSGNWNVTTWIAIVRSFAEDAIDLGVIPVLSTIPPEVAHLADGRVLAANAAVVALAEEMQIPWVDYHGLILHFQPLNWQGTLIGADGTHPSSATGGQGFSLLAQSTSDGYALRTKLTFDVAEKLRAIVFEDGPHDGAATEVAGGRVEPVAALSAWPIPTRGRVSLRYELTRMESLRFVVLDASGRRVREWAEHPRSSGAHHATWDGRDASGRCVANGVYFLALEGKRRREVARIVVVR